MLFVVVAGEVNVAGQIVDIGDVDDASAEVAVNSDVDENIDGACDVANVDSMTDNDIAEEDGIAVVHAVVFSVSTFYTLFLLCSLSLSLSLSLSIYIYIYIYIYICDIHRKFAWQVFVLLKK